MLRAATCVVLGAIACGQEGPPAPLAENADSAGIPVAVHRVTLGSSERLLELSETPELSIGQVEGSAPYLFDRVAGAAILSDGRIVVANAGTAEIRIFDGDGGHLRSVGREGDGPGEFRAIDFMSVFGGDSIIVYDGNSSQRRVSVFGPDGSLERLYRLPEGVVGSIEEVGVLNDGSLIVAQRAPVPRETGVFRPPITLKVVSTTGDRADVVGEFPGPEVSIVSPEGGGFLASLVPFGRNVHYSASGERIAVGTDDAFSLRLYDAAGGVVRIIRQSAPRVSPPDGGFADMEREILESAQDAVRRERLEVAFEQMPRHSELPAFGAIHADRQGRVWVEEYQPPRIERSRWQVFAADGSFIGNVRLPANVRLLDVGRDRLLGLHVDPLGIQRVQSYRLTIEGN